MRWISAIASTIVFLFGFTGVFPAVAQQGQQDQVDRIIEEALEFNDPAESGLNPEQYLSFLYDLAANPLNINEAGPEELLHIPGLSLKQARSIIDYREEHLPFEELNQLTDVKSIGPATLARIRPFVTTGDRRKLNRSLRQDPRYWSRNGRAELWSRYRRGLELREGYTRPDSSGYLGSPAQYYERFGYRSDHISMNLTQEKDAGEVLSGPQHFDYQSIHLSIRDTGLIRALVVGDYSLSFGQGLVVQGGGSFGKGRDVTGLFRGTGRGIKPYRSSYESGYHRGAALTVGRSLQLTGFYGSTMRSATPADGDTVGFPSSTGYHRTITELAKRNTVHERLFGGRAAYRRPTLTLGLTAYRTRFDKYIQRQDRLYNRYRFSGRKAGAFGLDMSWIAGAFQLGTETGRSLNGAWASITGIKWQPAEQTELAASYRNYAPRYQSIHAGGFGESSSGARNEEGFYLGIRHQLNRRIELSGYLDQYRFPVPRFNTHQPTRGYDWLGMIESKMTGDWSVYVLARSERKEEEFEALAGGRTVRRTGWKRRTSLRIHSSFRALSNLRLRSRFELANAHEAGGPARTGYLVYQDIRWSPYKNLTIDGRVTLFDTPDYTRRLYQFENDLLYVMSIPILYGRGERAYLLLHYEPFPFVDLWVKYGITLYEDRQTIGSGLDEIQGNTRSRIGAQLRLRF